MALDNPSAMPSDMELPVGPFIVSNAGRAMLIAEAGVNHNGDIHLAKELVQAAKEAGADCIKFQTFQADRLVTSAAPKAAYQRGSTDPDQSQLEMLRALELSDDHYQQLVQLCDQQQIVFLSTPYDTQGVDLLESLDVPAYKIASGQTVEPMFLEYVAAKGKPVFLSTGMCTLDEVSRAVGRIRAAGNPQIVVLQCTTSYPSPVAQANLRAMVTMRDTLGVLVGYSDHTPSLTTAAVAAGLGACVIERHFTLDQTLPGPDQSSSSDPREFASLVQMVREAEQSLGSPVKSPTIAEQNNMEAVRRGVVAKTFIPAGTALAVEHLTLKRPMSQYNGEELPKLLGRQTVIDIDTDTPIAPEMIQ